MRPRGRGLVQPRILSRGPRDAKCALWRGTREHPDFAYRVLGVPREAFGCRVVFHLLVHCL